MRCEKKRAGDKKKGGSWEAKDGTVEGVKKRGVD